jgi:predicted DNA-binding protein with PD1-like motif
MRLPALIMMREGKIRRVIVESLRRGEDVLDRLNWLVRDHGVTAGNFTALGAFQKATVGIFIGNGQYSPISYNGPLEVLSCVGNVSLKQGSPFIHAHLTFADGQGRAYGGHLMPGCIVSATLEVALFVYEGMELVRKLDPGTKLFLLDT